MTVVAVRQRRRRHRTPDPTAPISGRGVAADGSPTRGGARPRLWRTTHPRLPNTRCLNLPALLLLLPLLPLVRVGPQSTLAVCLTVQILRGRLNILVPLPTVEAERRAAGFMQHEVAIRGLLVNQLPTAGARLPLARARERAQRIRAVLFRLIRPARDAPVPRDAAPHARRRGAQGAVHAVQVERLRGGGGACRARRGGCVELKVKGRSTRGVGTKRAPLHDRPLNVEAGEIRRGLPRARHQRRTHLVRQGRLAPAVGTRDGIPAVRNARGNVRDQARPAVGVRAAGAPAACHLSRRHQLEADATRHPSGGRARRATATTAGAAVPAAAARPARSGRPGNQPRLG